MKDAQFLYFFFEVFIQNPFSFQKKLNFVFEKMFE